jgi:hypothetical protein
VQHVENPQVEGQLWAGLDVLGLLHGGDGLREPTEEEEALGLGEEGIEVIGSEGDGLVPEGSDGVLEGPVFEEELAGVFVDFRIVGFESYLASAQAYIYTPGDRGRPRCRRLRSAGTLIGAGSTPAGTPPPDWLPQ